MVCLLFQTLGFGSAVFVGKAAKGSVNKLMSAMRLDGFTVLYLLEKTVYPVKTCEKTHG